MEGYEILQKTMREERCLFFATPCINEYLWKHASGDNKILMLMPDLIPVKDMNFWRRQLRKSDGSVNYAILYEEYPGLKPILDKASLWSEQFFVEMMTRVEENRAEISRSFFHGEDFGTIVEISAAGADLHNHGRCTVALKTAKGNFLYKPRDMRIDAMFEEIVRNYFHECTYVPQCILKEGYGFSEFISCKAVADVEGLRQYFYNFGMLSGLFQALGSSDLHKENIFAMGEYPVLIDIETLVSHVAQSFNHYLENLSPDTFLYDLAYSLYPSCVFPGLENTDKINPLLALSETSYSLPIVDGTPYTVEGYEQDYLKGLAAGYRKCISLRKELLDILGNYRMIPVRRVLCDTNVYAQLMRLKNSPKYLEGEKAQNIIQNYLARYHISSRNDAAVLLKYEVKSIMEGDIPYFYSLAGSRDLYAEGKIIYPDFFLKSAMENAEERIRRMSEEELLFEQTIFREALLLSPRKLTKEETLQAIANQGQPEEESVCPISKEEALQEAEAILQRLQGHIMRGISGKSSFLIMEDKQQVKSMEWGLVSGVTGIGLLAAALLSVTKNETVYEMAEKTLEIVLGQFNEMMDYLSVDDNLIPEAFLPLGMDGLGGALRALMLMRDLAQEGHLERVAANDMVLPIEAAITKAMKLLTRIDFEHAERVDVLTGAAGLLQTLCRFPELRERTAGMEAAMKCADFILAHRTLATERGLLWRTLPVEHGISGMGHGMAGIGCTLMAAAAVLGREDLRETAEAAMRFEHQCYSEELNNWPDFRETPKVRNAMMGYCSGAPGIGLAVIACLRNGRNTPALQEDLNRAIHNAMTMNLVFRDHLCCGNSARLDFLLEACRETGRADVIDFTGRFVGRMVARKKKMGEYRALPANYKDVFITTFFHGEPGIGYELLRYYDPVKIRSVLI